VFFEQKCLAKSIKKSKKMELTVYTNNQLVEKHKLKLGEIVVGRKSKTVNQDIGISVNDEFLSRQHFTLDISKNNNNNGGTIIRPINCMITNIHENPVIIKRGNGEYQLNQNETQSLRSNDRIKIIKNTKTKETAETEFFITLNQAQLDE